MKSSSQLKKRLFPFGYESEYNLSSAISSQNALPLFSRCIRELIDEDSFPTGELTDQKGREPALLIDQNIPDHLKPVRDELFFVSGYYTPPQEEENSEDQESPEAEPFSISVYTDFHQFKGRNSICYSVETSDPEMLLPSLIATEVPADLNIALSRFRIGLEFFEARLISYMLGLTPSATKILLLEYAQEQVFVRIFAEALKSKASLPLPELCFSELDSIFESILGFSIAEDYFQLIRKSK